MRLLTVDCSVFTLVGGGRTFKGRGIVNSDVLKYSIQVIEITKDVSIFDRYKKTVPPRFFCPKSFCWRHRTARKHTVKNNPTAPGYLVVADAPSWLAWKLRRHYIQPYVQKDMDTGQQEFQTTRIGASIEGTWGY